MDGDPRATVVTEATRPQPSPGPCTEVDRRTDRQGEVKPWRQIPQDRAGHWPMKQKVLETIRKDAEWYGNMEVTAPFVQIMSTGCKRKAVCAQDAAMREQRFCLFFKIYA